MKKFWINFLKMNNVGLRMICNLISNVIINVTISTCSSSFSVSLRYILHMYDIVSTCICRVGLIEVFKTKARHRYTFVSNFLCQLPFYTLHGFPHGDIFCLLLTYQFTKTIVNNIFYIYTHTN
eukprot:535757_1